MSYIEDSLSAEEKVVAVFRQHWVTRLWLMLWILLLITIPIAIYEWLRLRTIEHGVTNKRVIYKHGIISRNTEEMKDKDFKMTAEMSMDGKKWVQGFEMTCKK